jgi:hypothetical protein
VCNLNVFENEQSTVSHAIEFCVGRISDWDAVPLLKLSSAGGIQLQANISVQWHWTIEPRCFTHANIKIVSRYWMKAGK